MVLVHVEFVDDGLQMRSRSLYGQDALLLEVPVRHTSVLHVPPRIFKHAVRFPHINQLLTNCAKGAVISESVPNGLH